MRESYRKILARNVAALMHARPELGSHVKLAAAARRAGHRVGPRTIGHLLNADGGPQPQLDTIVAIAEAARIAPWQLLQPDFDPASARAGRSDAAGANAAAQPPAEYAVPERDARALEALHTRAAELAAGLRTLYADITGQPPPARPSEVQIGQYGAIKPRERKRGAQKN